MSETPGVDYGSPGYARIGRIDPPLSPEVRDRERAEADRRWQVRLAAERAALAAGMSALQAAEAADKLIAQARETADRAVIRL
jgi:hypothetical protein